MIDVALKFLRDSLNTSFNAASPAASGGEPDVVTLVAGDKIGDSVGFTLGHVNLLLVKLEEESTLRPADPYARAATNGARERIYPEIRLNLYVLLVAHFADYALSLRWISQIVRYFQNHRSFSPANSPSLGPEIDQLTVELVTLPFAEQNEVWGALRASYRPSALYRVRMVVFHDQAATAEPTVKTVRIDLQS